RHFTFEADLLKRTDHPSLPRVYRSFDDPTQGRAYLLMDYIEGPNLEKLRRQQPEQRLPLAEALTLTGPIVEALAYLHAQQPPIIHRDIKPSNIIVPDSGERTMLVDFGIAKEFDQEATTTVIRRATPGYGAPEQYGTGTDTRTDIYGMGATLYTLLTGTPPADAFYRMTQQMSKGKDPLQPVKQVIPNIPDYVSDAIARAMALEKDERFATIEAFWQALQPDTLAESGAAPVSSAQHVAPIAQPSVVYRPVPERLALSSHPRGKWIALALLLLLALGIGFTIAFASFSNLRGQQANAPTAKPGMTVTHAATATPTPSPQPTPTATPTAQPTATPTAQSTSSVPSVASTYTGTLHDNNGNIDTIMSLRGMTQSGQSIQGTFRVALPLNGNGPFAGTVKSDSSIKFIVHSSDLNASAPLFFTGQIQQNGNINGHYCSLNTSGHCDPNVGGYGTWSVQPNNS
ncbi:MAG TPA: serine/threonine-protein kinase, partial [Ktedonobacteraceae bacterium]|nr:serine/threonine-protein kinase [Ktedonobacteraceae bacterium]